VISTYRLRNMYGRTVQVTISIPMLLLQKIDDFAEEYGTTRSHMTAVLVVQGLSRFQLLLTEEIKEKSNKG